MNRRLLVFILIVVAAIAGLAVVVRYVPRGGHHAPQATTYYCPMHPTYTSDKPGDCPICNMRLIPQPKAAEEATPQPMAQASEGQTAETICYLHQCDKLHEGKPCPMTIVAKPGEVVRCPVCGNYVAGPEGQLKKVLYWTDPMIPDFKADQPGKSPMGMDLVPVYEEATPPAGAIAAPEGYAPVVLTPQKQQLTGVTTAPVATRTITKTIRAVGRIAYDPALYQTEAEFLESQKALHAAQAANNAAGVAEAQRLVDSSRLKLRLQGLSESLIDDIAAQGIPDKSLLLAGADDHVWLYASVYEYELPYVKVGQAVQVEASGAPGQVFDGTIRAIDSVLDPLTRSARVRAVLTAPGGTLKPEMYVNASLLIEIGNVLAVPVEAVFHTGTAQIVFLDRGQGLFEPRALELGVEADGFYAVKAGLSPGDVVVTSGNFLIDSESRLKAALQGMSGAGHQHGQ
jgi:Cu(I)/Ag(I) efflux system membrane fusion protein/cobalt-zinc-cadmium efflux system membrane fusion protein